MMKILVAESWVGEFGWELMSWQGYLRKLAPAFDKCIVCAPTGHECLYADFSTSYIAYDHSGTRDCWWTRKGTADHSEINKQLDRFGGTRITHGYIPIEDQQFIKFGDTKCGEMTDVLVHARGAFGTRPDHSWPLAHWNTVVEDLLRANLKVAAIGSRDGAACPQGALDWRGIPLSQLADNMSATRLVVGPSSGPMHLASLCGTPHLVWTDQSYYSAIRATNRLRYELLWNPLGTPCRVVERHGWKPPVACVLKEIIYCLERFRR